MDDENPPLKKFSRKAFAELKEFVLLSFYLYLCFGAVILYAMSMLLAHGIDYEPYGFALIKSLIMAKFIMIGNALNIGKSYRHKPLIWLVIFKSFAYLVFLMVLSAIEEITAGLIHGRSAIATLSEFGGGTGLQILATCFLLWLVLLPIVGIQQLSNVLGKSFLYLMFVVAD